MYEIEQFREGFTNSRLIEIEDEEDFEDLEEKLV